MDRNPRDDDAPGADLDEEQYIQRLQPDRLHREEVAGDDHLGLGSEELGPGGPGASWRRTQAVSPQQRPDCRGADPDAELAELPGDSDAAPARVLPRHPQDQPSNFRVDRWPA